LIVKAENITVEHLKDKDTNKVSGGGIEVTGVASKKESTVDYKAYFKNMYEGKDISGNEAQKIIDGIPEENKEKIAISDSSNNIAGTLVMGRWNVGVT